MAPSPIKAASLGFLALFGALFFLTGASADPIKAVVVSSCGTPPTTYNAGQAYPITMDTTGKICDSGSGGGGGGVTTPVTVGDLIIGGPDTSHVQDSSAAASAVLPSALNYTGNIAYGAGAASGPANGGGIWFNGTAGINASGICSDASTCYLNNFTINDNVDASAAANGLTDFLFVDSVGSSSKKGRVGVQSNLLFSAAPATPGGNYVAVAGTTSINVSLGGVGGMFGGNFKVSAGASANLNGLVGTEIDAHALSGAVYKDFILSQFVIESTHAQAGTEMNTGVLVAAQSNTVPRPDTLFQDGAFQGFPASSSNTTVFRCYPHANTGSCPTIAAGIDLTKYTITGNAYASPGFAVDGSGNITANSCTGCGSSSSSPFPIPDYISSTWYQPIHGMTLSAGTSAVTANTIYCVFGGVGANISVKALQARVTSGVTGNVQGAIYSVSGGTLTFIDSTPSVSTASPGNLTLVPASQPDALTKSTLYAWCTNSSGAPTYATFSLSSGGAVALIGGSQGNTVTGSVVIGYSIAQTFGTWPGTLTLSGMTQDITAVVPQVGFEVN